MSGEVIFLIVVGLLAALSVGGLLHWKLPKRLKHDYYQMRWKEIQGYCKDKSNWTQAIVEADQLLDRALKRRKMKGKSMGERMVSAQRTFTDNDSAWYAHNLSKKIVAEEKTRLKEKDVKDALVGFRQALRDIGALPGDK